MCGTLPIFLINSIFNKACCFPVGTSLFKHIFLCRTSNQPIKWMLFVDYVLLRALKLNYNSVFENIDLIR